MAYRVAIIGSFQKYYYEVVEIIKILKRKGLFINSPVESNICNKIDDFVIFKTDDVSYSPEEIQLITLEKIINSDAVYVYNPDGYVGRTTCYEIGFCLSRFIPLYYLCKPKDLPIPINNNQILSPECFANLLLKNEHKFHSVYKICKDAQNSFNNIFSISEENSYNKIKKVVICGSMKFYDDMVDCKNRLKDYNIQCIIPKDEHDIIDKFSEEQFREFKRKVSSAHLKKIRGRETMAVLIYNETKNGQINYIGANTLVEIAMAFTWNRRIFLYNDIYKPLEDELLAWGCISLHGDLEKLVEELKLDELNNINYKRESYQLSLFENDTDENK